MNHEDASKLGKPGFWQDLLTTWAKVHFFDQQNGQNVRNQQLCLNSHIKANIPLVRMLKLKQNGIVRIKDIVEDNGNFRPRTWINDKYNCRITQMEYNSLISAIPHHWKFFLRSPDLIDVQSDKWDIIKSNVNVSRILYHNIIHDDFAIIHSGKAWRIKLGDSFDTHVHSKVFANIFKITNIVKYRAFQFKLLHNKIFCNDVLFHWKIKSTQNCEFCEFAAKQTILHMM